MKKLTNILMLLIVVSLFSCHSNSQKKSAPEVNKSQIEQFEKVFSSLKEFLLKENGKLWGKQLYGPILLVDRKTRLIFANEPDDKSVLTKRGNIYVGLLPKEVNISNTAINWNGKRWTMLMLPLPRDEHDRLNLMTHELFHRIQPELGFNNLKEVSGNHLDDMNGRIYLKLELEALKKALEAENDNLRRKDIKNALLFRLYRDQLYPGEQKAENALELNEGLAEYTGSMLSNRDDKALKAHYVSAIDSFYGNQTFVRSFAYVTLPVYGYFMNKTRPNWNKEITDTTHLTNYMIRFFHVSVPARLKRAVNQIKGQYGFDTISKFEIKRAELRKKLMEKFEVLFQKDPTLTLHFQNMRIQFDPRNIMPFKGLGTVYPSMRVTDNWGILTVSGGALLSKNWDKVTVSEPTSITDTLVQGAGWKLELNKGWRVVHTGRNYLLEKK